MILINTVSLQDINSALLRLQRAFHQEQQNLEGKVSNVISGSNKANGNQYNDTAIRQMISALQETVGKFSEKIEDNTKNISQISEKVAKLQTLVANINLTYDEDSNTLTFTNNQGKQVFYQLKDTTYTFSFDTTSQTFTIHNDLEVKENPEWDPTDPESPQYIPDDTNDFVQQIKGTTYTFTFANGSLTIHNNLSTTEHPIADVVINFDDRYYTEDEIDALVASLDGRLDAIEAVIPAEASANNKLADKDWVATAISISAATFRGTFDSLAQLQAYTGPKDSNDFAFVKTSSGYDQYTYVVSGSSGTWTYEFSLETLAGSTYVEVDDHSCNYIFPVGTRVSSGCDAVATLCGAPNHLWWIPCCGTFGAKCYTNSAGGASVGACMKFGTAETAGDRPLVMTDASYGAGYGCFGQLLLSASAHTLTYNPANGSLNASLFNGPAKSLIDYNCDSKTIKVGWSGSGLETPQYLAGYCSDSNGCVYIKDTPFCTVANCVKPFIGATSDFYGLQDPVDKYTAFGAESVEYKDISCNITTNVGFRSHLGIMSLHQPRGDYSQGITGYLGHCIGLFASKSDNAVPTIGCDCGACLLWNAGGCLWSNCTITTSPMNVCAASSSVAYKTVDLSGLCQDLLYPVITANSYCINEIKVDVSLDGRTVPSWSTHGNGFSLHVDLFTIGEGWGVNSYRLWTKVLQSDWVNTSTCNIIGNTKSFTNNWDVLYLRGGGKYYVWNSNGSDFTVVTTSCTDAGGIVYQPVAPGSAPQVWQSGTSCETVSNAINTTYLGGRTSEQYFCACYNCALGQPAGNMAWMENTQDGNTWRFILQQAWNTCNVGFDLWRAQLSLPTYHSTTQHVMYRHPSCSSGYPWCTWRQLIDDTGGQKINGTLENNGTINTPTTCTWSLAASTAYYIHIADIYNCASNPIPYSGKNDFTMYVGALNTAVGEIVNVTTTQNGYNWQPNVDSFTVRKGDWMFGSPYSDYGVMSVFFKYPQSQTSGTEKVEVWAHVRTNNAHDYSFALRSSERTCGFTPVMSITTTYPSESGYGIYVVSVKKGGKSYNYLGEGYISCSAFSCYPYVCPYDCCGSSMWYQPVFVDSTMYGDDYAALLTGKSIYCRMLFQPYTGTLDVTYVCRNVHSCKLPNPGGTTRYVLICYDSSSVQSNAQDSHADFDLSYYTCSLHYNTQATINYACGPAYGCIQFSTCSYTAGESSNCFWLKYVSYWPPIICSAYDFKVVCDTTATPSGVTFSNFTNITDAGGSTVTNATCFAGHTWQEAYNCFTSSLSITGKCDNADYKIVGVDGNGVTVMSGCSGMTFNPSTGVLTAPIFKSDSSCASIEVGHSNEVNFTSNAPYIYLNYRCGVCCVLVANGQNNGGYGCLFAGKYLLNDTNEIAYKNATRNGLVIHDNQTCALYIEGSEAATGDTGGLAITNDGVTLFGAGDTNGILRVVNEDNVAAGSIFNVFKNGCVCGDTFRMNNLYVANSACVQNNYTLVDRYCHTIYGNTCYIKIGQFTADSDITTDYKSNTTDITFSMGGSSVVDSSRILISRPTTYPSISIDFSNFSIGNGILGIGWVSGSGTNQYCATFELWAKVKGDGWSSPYSFNLYKNKIADTWSTCLSCITSVSPNFTCFICNQGNSTGDSFHWMSGFTCSKNYNYRTCASCNVGSNNYVSLVLRPNQLCNMQHYAVCVVSSCCSTTPSCVYIDRLTDARGCSFITSCVISQNCDYLVPYRVSTSNSATNYIIIDFATCCNATLTAYTCVSNDGDWNCYVESNWDTSLYDAIWPTSITINTDCQNSSFITTNMVANAITACCIVTTSSKKYKKDIIPYTDSALNILRCTDVVSYKYKNESENDLCHLGIIAEDTNNIISGKNKNEMRISDTIGLLMKAVQELDENQHPFKKLLKRIFRKWK